MTATNQHHNLSENKVSIVYQSSPEEFYHEERAKRIEYLFDSSGYLKKPLKTQENDVNGETKEKVIKYLKWLEEDDIVKDLPTVFKLIINVLNIFDWPTVPGTNWNTFDEFGNVIYNIVVFKTRNVCMTKKSMWSQYITYAIHENEEQKEYILNEERSFPELNFAEAPPCLIKERIYSYLLEVQKYQNCMTHKVLSDLIFFRLPKDYVQYYLTSLESSPNNRINIDQLFDKFEFYHKHWKKYYAGRTKSAASYDGILDKGVIETIHD